MKVCYPITLMTQYGQKLSKKQKISNVSLKLNWLYLLLYCLNCILEFNNLKMTSLL